MLLEAGLDIEIDQLEFGQVLQHRYALQDVEDVAVILAFLEPQTSQVLELDQNGGAKFAGKVRAFTQLQRLEVDQRLDDLQVVIGPVLHGGQAQARQVWELQQGREVALQGHAGHTF